MIVELRVVLAADHREEQYVLFVNGWVCDFEPELDGVLARPLLERRCVEANIALWCVEMSRHVSVIASDSIENLVCVSQSAQHIVALPWNLEENILKALVTRYFKFTAKISLIDEAVLFESLG